MKNNPVSKMLPMLAMAAMMGEQAFRNIEVISFGVKTDGNTMGGKRKKIIKKKKGNYFTHQYR
jgi:hypothetical protein